jgi:Fe-Mn family superoxide dismutase
MHSCNLFCSTIRQFEVHTMQHQLPPLPFARDALEPHISRETLDFHYGKHHAAYVKKLNELIAGTDFEDAPLEDIVRFASGGIFNNGAQAWNHDFYWKCLAARGGGKPAGDLAQAIKSAFGSFEGFHATFTQAADNLFGSGWVWLAQTSSGGLAVLSAADAGNPLRDGHKPLLACDVWEHAYYIDRRNARPDYVKAFWEVVNWNFAAENFAAAPERHASDGKKYKQGQAALRGQGHTTPERPARAEPPEKRAH